MVTLPGNRIGIVNLRKFREGVVGGRYDLAEPGIRLAPNLEPKFDPDTGKVVGAYDKKTFQQYSLEELDNIVSQNSVNAARASFFAIHSEQILTACVALTICNAKKFRVLRKISSAIIAASLNSAVRPSG